MAVVEEPGAVAQHPASPPSSRNSVNDESDFDFAQRPPPPPTQQPPAAPAARGADDDHHHNHNQEVSEQIAEERLSFEAVRRALAEARAELGRKGCALRQETDRRRAVEGRVRQAEELARAAGKRAEAADAATARANGRVSVLERNVEYLQTQQRALRYVYLQYCFRMSERVEAVNSGHHSSSHACYCYSVRRCTYVRRAGRGERGLLVH